MHHIETVVAYWRGLRDEAAGPPRRSQIAPSSIFSSLAYVFIAEDREGLPVLRLAGTALNQAFGMNLHGVELHGIWSPSDARKMLRMLDKAYADGEPCVFVSDFRSLRGRTGELQVACLPFLEKDGCIGTLGAFGMTPFLPEGLDRIARVELRGDRRLAKPPVSDPLREELALLARRRGDDRVDPYAARLLREAGGTRLQPMRLTGETKR